MGLVATVELLELVIVLVLAGPLGLGATLGEVLGSWARNGSVIANKTMENRRRFRQLVG